MARFCGDRLSCERAPEREACAIFSTASTIRLATRLGTAWRREPARECANWHTRPSQRPGRFGFRRSGRGSGCKRRRGGRALDSPGCRPASESMRVRVRNQRRLPIVLHARRVPRRKVRRARLRSRSGLLTKRHRPRLGLRRLRRTPGSRRRVPRSVFDREPLHHATSGPGGRRGLRRRLLSISFRALPGTHVLAGLRVQRGPPLPWDLSLHRIS